MRLAGEELSGSYDGFSAWRIGGIHDARRFPIDLCHRRQAFIGLSRNAAPRILEEFAQETRAGADVGVTSVGAQATLRAQKIEHRRW